ncbi:beta-N-acetylhexosaminidase [Parasulfitobacter algicola]|uniref:beta-N-acetylhexosaminidase n=1 Tax=Parasulfitobacter algicola TaxID=2614809 RepID=A0ABX2IY75_9RHOB|nr:beta-N-acetylhexosaminidase [Sulfitobacter algicola]NSX55163.1 beta-N-acetylhexosaminidase [Sulfitobacter algicola]
MASGAYIFGCSGQNLTPDERAFFRDADPWGFILFARNINAPDQIRGLTLDLRETVGRDAPILIDQEGGRVQRLTAPRWRNWLPPLDHMQQAGVGQAIQSMYLRYRLIAHELRTVGIDVNCAPMADVANAQTHDFLKNRCYGTDVSDVVDAARAVANGLMDGGVLPIVKHIPGHGRATLDSHKDLPRVDTDIGTLRDTDFAAFKGLSDLPMAMTAHIVYSAIDPNLPATTSPQMMQLIRDEIGFDGLIMSDDVSMEALSGTIGERSAASLAAGCDVVLHCNGVMDEMQAVVSASGVMTKPAERRAENALSCKKTPDTIDIATVEADLKALLNGRVYG